MPAKRTVITRRGVIQPRANEVLLSACEQAAMDLHQNRVKSWDLVRALCRVWPEPATHEELVTAIRQMLPLDNWRKHTKPDDDNRDLTLLALGSERLKTVDIWPQLKLLLERKGHFNRLSLYLYKQWGKAEQTVLATSLEPNAERARRRARDVIGRYRDIISYLPDALEARLPWDQWFEALLDGIENPRCNESVLPAPKGVLTIEPTKGALQVNSLARWAISPSVVLAFQERVDRPALFLITRRSPTERAFRQKRIASVPMSSIQIKYLRASLVCAVASDISNPDLDHGDYHRTLIDTVRLRRKGGCARTAAEAALDALPLLDMLTLYDKAILSMRLNGHKQRLFPDIDDDMRWITHVGRHNRTARKNAWWVLVGHSRQGRGEVFAWDGNPQLALKKAKAWRDHVIQEQSSGLAGADAARGV